MSNANNVSAADIAKVAEALAAFFDEHMTQSPDGQYYATPELAIKLTAFLADRGFQVLIGVDADRRFTMVKA